jgi:GNAT superfamily N-acetyltransferase
MTNARFDKPVPISKDHDIAAFSCGVPSLDHWLQRNALNNERTDASRTYVVCEGHAVVAFYALSSGSIARELAPKPLQRNSPDPIPVTILGRIAVDTRFQGLGYGSDLLREALLRCLAAAEQIGSKAVLVNAISEAARSWYLDWGFLESTHDPMTLCLPMTTIRKTL